MSGITLVLSIWSVIIAGAHFALVNGDAAPYRPVNVDPRNSAYPSGTWGSCWSSEGCSEENPWAEIEYCEVTKDYIPGCVTYSELVIKNARVDVIRGCASRLRSCEEIRKQHNILNGTVLLNCTECPDDNCNEPLLQKNSK